MFSGLPQFIGTTGVVQHITDSGDLIVSYPGQAIFPVNPQAVTKVCIQLYKRMPWDWILKTTRFLRFFMLSVMSLQILYKYTVLYTQVEGVAVYRVGDAVRVNEDKDQVAREQKGHGGWREEMADVRCTLLLTHSYLGTFHTCS